MISDIEEETLDLDWFGVDIDGKIAHFASGGRGFLPSSVKSSKDALDRLTEFFRHSLLAHGTGIESPNLSSHVQFESESYKSRFLTDYARMASKGLYSFDCIVSSQRPTGYFKVIAPSRPLTVDDIPSDIQQSIAMTRFPRTFASADVIQAMDFC